MYVYYVAVSMVQDFFSSFNTLLFAYSHMTSHLLSKFLKLIHIFTVALGYN